jgi:predicted ATPase
VNQLIGKKRIVLTGGPGGGKTTALDLFQRELGNKISCVPESATMLFSGGIARSEDPEVINAQQKAIFSLQKNLEFIQRKASPQRLILCDRGTLDGLAYWNGSQESFFATMNSSYEYELSRYDAVIFFETAVKSGGEIKSNNPYRNESDQAAIELDDKLQHVWSCHPNFHLVQSADSFINKVMFGIKTIEQVIEEM